MRGPLYWYEHFSGSKHAIDAIAEETRLQKLRTYQHVGVLGMAMATAMDVLVTPGTISRIQDSISEAYTSGSFVTAILAAETTFVQGGAVALGTAAIVESYDMIRQVRKRMRDVTMQTDYPEAG